MVRTVIITPGQLGMNPRTVKEAEALQNAGHQVHVIATKLVHDLEPRDREIMANANWDLQRIPFDNPWVRRQERLLQEVARRTWPIFRWATAQAASPFARRLANAAVAIPADLYIAHYPPALPAAALAAKRWNGLFAFDAEDFHLGDLPDTPEHMASKSVIREIEGRYLPDTAFVTAASPGIARAYAREYRIPLPLVVLNTFPIPRKPTAPTAAGTARGPSVYWFSQTVGPDRGLETALRAIALASTRPHLYLRGTPQSGYAQSIMALAEALRCEDRIHLLPPGMPSEMEVLASVYDVGLVGETGYTHNRRIALVNKVFTYFLAGLPALLSDIPAHQEFEKKANGGAFLYRTEDAVDLACRMDALLGNRKSLETARSRAFTLGRERFNWDVEASKLLSLVEATTSR